MTKDRIYLSSIPSGTPSSLLIRGKLFVDLPVNFSFQLTENLESLTILDKIQTSGVLDFEIDYTERNIFIFQDYMSPNTVDRSFDPIDVRCFGGGTEPLRQNQIFYRGSDDSSRKIYLSLVDGSDFWLNQSQNLKISSLDFGTMTLSVSEVMYNWAQYQWNHTNPSKPKFWFALAHYGRFWRQQDDFIGITMEDLLPWLSVPAILKTGFEAMGWQFDTPLYDSPWFNRLWTLLVEKEVDYDNKGQHFYVDAATSEDITMLVSGSGSLIQHIYFENETLDPSGSHEVNVFTGGQGTTVKRSVYINLTEISSDFRMRLKGDIFNPGGQTLKFDIVVVVYEELTELGGVYNVEVNGGETKTIDVFIDFNLDWAQQATVVIQGLGNTTGIITVLTGFEMEVRPTSKRLYRFDDIPINQIINEDYYFIDFLKGVVHLGDWYLKTDFGSRTVYLYPQEESDVYGEIIEGFLKSADQSLNVTQYIQQGSRKIIVPTEEENRFFQLKFKGNGDEYIKKVLNIETENPLWGRVYDMGRGDDKKPTQLSNPFFEPMGNIEYNALELPAVWDNDDNKRTKTITPRIGVAVGYTSQAFTSSTTGAASVSWTFEYQPRTALPWISQRPTRAKFVVGTGYVETEESVVYGGAKEGKQDLFVQFWDNVFISKKYSKVYEFIIFVGQELFDKMDFRTRLLIVYGEETALYRLTAKVDYRTSSKLPMIIRTRPEPSRLKLKY